ncbi:MAG: DUF2937 family protein [Rhodobacteraceae bacterium]|nr:DUF2937 family protein [Paracoccaceae bacterium]
MIGRILGVSFGLLGAATFSQLPEFTQQYTQRLGGAVDELEQFVAEFDTDAAQTGLSRGEALKQLAQAGQFGAARAETITQTIARQERLSADLNALRSAGPWLRVVHAGRSADADIMQATYADFQPAVPLTAEGAGFAAAGFAGGAGLLAVLRAMMRRLRRRGFAGASG